MNPSEKPSDAGREPTDLELMLPFHAAETLSLRDARRVEDALARDADLARQYRDIQDEHAETILLNECLGAPSERARQKLFAAIDAEPARVPFVSYNPIRRIAEFVSGLSSRTLAWSAVAGACVIVLQAGVIGNVITNRGPIQTASYQAREAATAVLLRFAPETSIADITRLLTSFDAKIVAGPNAGMFRVQVGDKVLPKNEAAQLLAKLQGEKIVSLAVLAE